MLAAQFTRWAVDNDDRVIHTAKEHRNGWGHNQIMAGISLTQVGSSGIQSGLEQAQRAAQDIARVGTASDPTSSLASLVESSVDLLEAKNQVQASAKLISAGDEILGTIIDTIA